MTTDTTIHVNQKTLDVREGSKPAGYGYLYATAYRRGDEHPLRHEGAWIMNAGPPPATASIVALREWIMKNDSGDNLFGCGLQECDLEEKTTYVG